MKHYFWHRSDGSLGGQLTFQGGFPYTCDPSDPKTTDPVAMGLRAKHTADPSFAGFVAYSCHCPPGKSGFCACCGARTRDSLVVDGAIKAMPVVAWDVDGEVVPAMGVGASPLDKTPGTDVLVKLVGDVPDGTQVNLRGGGQPDLAASFPIVLTFAKGQTNTATLRAPASGFAGSVYAFNRVAVRVTRLCIRGW